MSAFHCKYCNATAISKCSKTRTVFPDDQTDAILSNILKYNIVRANPRAATVSLMVNVPLEKGADIDRTDPELVEWALMLINELDPKMIKAYSCNHEWVIDEGKCMFGCCVTPDPKPVESKS